MGKTAWTIEYEGTAFEAFLFSLPEYEQAVLVAAIEQVLARYGIDICTGEWGRPLGDGLYEFRVKKSLKAILKFAGIEHDKPGADRTVLLRVFCTFHGSKVVLLFHGYAKKRDPSARRQQKEIKKAARTLREWKSRRA